MPILANNRHELFAQGIADGKTIDQAYEDAGFKRNRGNAARLNAEESIRARVTELLSRSAAKVELNRAWVLERLMRMARISSGEEEITLRARQKNRNDGSINVIETTAHEYDASAAIRALELLGKEIGLFVERVNTENINRIISDKPLSETEWLERFTENN
jgi:hypothetical protein